MAIDTYGNDTKPRYIGLSLAGTHAEVAVAQAAAGLAVRAKRARSVRYACRACGMCVVRQLLVGTLRAFILTWS